MTAATVADVIDGLGGNRPVAEALGLRENTVSTWRVRGLPAWVRGDLRTMAEAAGISFDESIFGPRRHAAAKAAA